MSPRRGANAIEFALLMPLFVLLIGTVGSFSWFVYWTGSLRTGLEDACRAGSLIDPGDGSANFATVVARVDTVAKNRYLQAGGSCADCTVSVTEVGLPPARLLRCTMQASYADLTGFVGFDGANVIQHTVTMRYERQRNP